MDEKERVRLQEKHLTYLADSKKGFTFTDTFVPYTSGEIGNYYVQSGAVQERADTFYHACQDMIKMVGEHASQISAISGGESRDWMFSLPVAHGIMRPHVMIYKDGKMVGADVSKMTVAHVADLNNEGSSPRDLWVPAIRNNGGYIDQIFFYVDRMEDGLKVMKDLELESRALVPLDAHAWDYLQKHGVVTPNIYISLMERMEDKDSWARAMLRSDKGLVTLAKLFFNENTISKARRIMEKGYPDMRQELIDRLRNYDRDKFAEFSKIG